MEDNRLPQFPQVTEFLDWLNEELHGLDPAYLLFQKFPDATDLIYTRYREENEKTKNESSNL